MKTEYLLAGVVFVMLCIATATGAYLFASGPTLTDGLPDDVDAFEWGGHTCVRWHKGRGSDMECWEAQ